MSEKRTVFFACLAVEGIQKYIFSTGRLKEMIGGSEIIAKAVTQEFFEKSLPGMQASYPENFTCKPGEYIVCQANAGALRLVFSEKSEAQAFLRSMSERLLSKFPGLPFYGALCAFEWSNDGEGKSAYMKARRDADMLIAKSRNRNQPANGCQMLPILRAARLDGRPAAESDGRQELSLPSLAKIQPELIEQSRKRLQGLVSAPDGVKLEWKDDLEEMLRKEGGKAALICMDGNDVGKLFASRRDAADCANAADLIRAMTSFSNLVEECNKQAFGEACSRIAARLVSVERYRDDSGGLVMPLRPIVLGGDDITLIARSEIALPFILLFTRAFEKAARTRGLALSLGIGMVVMDASYPFVKAFPLAESLQDSAKNLTRGMKPEERPSSLDYLVLTEEMEDNEALVRQRLFTGPNGEALTVKPFRLQDGEFMDFLKKGERVRAELPRSQLRNAWTLCRLGEREARKIWENMRDNIERKLGGRKGMLMDLSAFESIFPENFFSSEASASGKRARTALGDYLELSHLMPEEKIFSLEELEDANA